MPITPATLTPNLVSNLNSVGISGTSALQLANGIAVGFSQYLPTIPVTTVHVGILGTGTGTGKFTITPASGIPTVSASLNSVGISGTSAPSLATGVINALSSELNTNAIVQVVLAGTAAGTGTGTLAAASGPALASSLLAAFGGNAILGTSSASLAQGLGNGIATWLRTGIINTVDVGTPIPPFPSVTGAGQGFIF